MAGKIDSAPPRLPKPNRSFGKPADKPGSVPLLRGLAIIPLGLPSPTGSSNLPGSSAGHASASLFGLAPDGVCHAAERYRQRGELLPRRFALT